MTNISIKEFEYIKACYLRDMHLSVALSEQSFPDNPNAIGELDKYRQTSYEMRKKAQQCTTIEQLQELSIELKKEYLSHYGKIVLKDIASPARSQLDIYYHTLSLGEPSKYFEQKQNDYKSLNKSKYLPELIKEKYLSYLTPKVVSLEDLKEIDSLLQQLSNSTQAKYITISQKDLSAGNTQEKLKKINSQVQQLLNALEISSEDLLLQGTFSLRVNFSDEGKQHGLYWSEDKCIELNTPSSSVLLHELTHGIDNFLSEQVTAVPNSYVSTTAVTKLCDTNSPYYPAYLELKRTITSSLNSEKPKNEISAQQVQVIKDRVYDMVLQQALDLNYHALEPDMKVELKKELADKIKNFLTTSASVVDLNSMPAQAARESLAQSIFTCLEKFKTDEKIKNEVLATLSKESISLLLSNQTSWSEIECFYTSSYDAEFFRKNHQYTRAHALDALCVFRPLTHFAMQGIRKICKKPSAIQTTAKNLNHFAQPLEIFARAIETSVLPNDKDQQLERIGTLGLIYNKMKNKDKIVASFKMVFDKSKIAKYRIDEHSTRLSMTSSR